MGNGVGWSDGADEGFHDCVGAGDVVGGRVSLWISNAVSAKYYE